MKTMIYILRGKTGEYSDRNEWTVAVYRSQKLAEDHMRAAYLRYQEFADTSGDRPRAYRLFMGALDPEGNCDYNGTEYEIEALIISTRAPAVPNTTPRDVAEELARLAFVRASGEMLCTCGVKYWKHPHDTGEHNFLIVLCDGRRVKI